MSARAGHWFRVVVKPLLMPALAAHFLTRSQASGSGGDTATVLAAHAGSWVGDLALNGTSRRSFVAGLSAFLLAHVAYISAFRARSSAPLLGTPQRRGLLAAGTTLSAGMALAARRSDPALALPVAAYGATLTTMVTAAAAIDRERGRDQVLAGASLFLVSDTLIGVREFLAGKRGTALGVAVMTTYAAAQWCIVEGLTRGRTR